MRRFLLLAAFLALAPVGLGGAPVLLLAPADSSPFDVGSASGQVLLADANRDGQLDLVTRHQQARTVRLHLGDGRASFETTWAAPALGFAPSDMALGDVNADTILDLVVTASMRDVVDVLLGNGTGFTRAAGSPFAASRRVYRYNKRSLHLVDVNADGELDVVTANRRGQYAFRVLLGNGRGRFAPGPVLNVEPAQEGYTLAFGDVDGDRDVDIVTALSSPDRGRLDVHLSNGRGAFRRPPAAAVALPPTYRIEALADLNGDRRPDLVLSHRQAIVSVLVNRGGGRFAHTAGSPFGIGARPFSVAIADVDRDDRIDLVGATADRVTVLLGTRLAFPRARQSSFPAGPGAYDIAVGDLNGDRALDVVASSFESNAVTVLLGR